jgi:hypothetical protein
VIVLAFGRHGPGGCSEHTRPPKGRGRCSGFMEVTEHRQRRPGGAAVEQVMGELGLNDNQGAAVTLSFTAVYSVGLLPVGWLADKLPRPPLLALSISMWSTATLCTAYAPSFWCAYRPPFALPGPWFVFHRGTPRFTARRQRAHITACCHGGGRTLRSEGKLPPHCPTNGRCITYPPSIRRQMHHIPTEQPTADGSHTHRASDRSDVCESNTHSWGIGGKPEAKGARTQHTRGCAPGKSLPH